MPVKYNGNNIQLAKNLRKNATFEEKHLWYDFLAEYRPRFQRQKAIGNFIADFYCHKAKIIIELDGSQHFTKLGMQKDFLRTQFFEGYDIEVIRFSNKQIRDNFSGVCEYIDKIIKEKLSR